MTRSSLTVAALLIPLIVAAADRLKVKTGLWEVVSITTMQGMPPIPDSVLGKLTPDQRAKMAEMLQAQGAAPKTYTRKHCVKPEDLDKPIWNQKNCSSKILESSSTSQDIEVVCSGEMPGKGHLHINTPTPESMNGHLDLTIGSGERVMTGKTELKGRWLGESCKGGDED